MMRAGKVVGSGKEIQFIHRDEEIHTVLFANLFKVLKLENGLTDETVCKIYDLLRKATELEIEWGIHVTQNQILGINNADLGKYVKFLANERIKAMGLDKQYGLLYPEDTVNTMPWVDVAKNINGIKSDFFTSDVATYTVGTSNDDLFD
jgi:ribonucleoside-diphosphate reductase beta chain